MMMHGQALLLFEEKFEDVVWSQRWSAEQDVYEMVEPEPPAFLKVGDGFEIRPRFRSAAASHTFAIT